MRRLLRSSFGCGILVVVLSLSLSGLLAGCGSHADNPLSQMDLTGGETPDGRAQTAAADDLELASLKARIDVTKPENKKLTDAILNIRATRQYPQKAPGNSAPSSVLLNIQFKPDAFILREITLSVKLAREGAELKGTGTNDSSSDPYLRASLTCRDRACDTMVLRLQSFGEDGVSTAGEAGAVLRFKRVEIQTKRSADADAANETKVSPTLNQLIENVARRTERQLETVEVAWGTSRFSLDLADTGVCPSGLLVETNEIDENLATTCAKGVKAPGPSATPGKAAAPVSAATEGGITGGGQSSEQINAALLGNNKSGGLVLRLSDSKDAVYLSVVSAKSKGTHHLSGSFAGPAPSAQSSEPDAGDPDRSLISAPEVSPEIVTNGFIPFDLNNPVTKSWQRDLNRPEIKAAMADWIKSDRLKEFLKRVQPNLPTLVKAMQDTDAPTEMIFITMIESNYFVESGYPIEASGAGAVGPWQFMPETASKTFALRVRPVRRVGNSYVADACDERADLAKSTRAAGQYFRMLFDMFKKDPKLAIMAYNWGQGKVGDTVDCLTDGRIEGTSKSAQAKNQKCQAHLAKRSDKLGRLKDFRRMGIDYWAVREFNMAPKESIDYVVKFVSGQFVGREPAKYGVTPPNPSTNPIRKVTSSCVR